MFNVILRVNDSIKTTILTEEDKMDELDKNYWMGIITGIGTGIIVVVVLTHFGII